MDCLGDNPWTVGPIWEAGVTNDLVTATFRLDPAIPHCAPFLSLPLWATSRRVPLHRPSVALLCPSVALLRPSVCGGGGGLVIRTGKAIRGQPAAGSTQGYCGWGYGLDISNPHQTCTHRRRFAGMLPPQTSRLHDIKQYKCTVLRTSRRWGRPPRSNRSPPSSSSASSTMKPASPPSSVSTTGSTPARASSRRCGASSMTPALRSSSPPARPTAPLHARASMTRLPSD
jgi:hypothetical protein